MATPEWVLVTLKVIEVLDALGVPYIIVGSTASIVHGTMRTTVDADLVAEINLEHIEPLVAALNDEFYIEPEQIRDAIRRRRSFNLIHQRSMFKVDVFIPQGRHFDQVQFSRRVERVISQNPERSVWLVSAEDVVLSKLEWFRSGGEVSERQWRDVLGVIKTQAENLDLEYMREMATRIAVGDLLERAFEQAEK